MKELRQQVRAALTGPVCSIPTAFVECDDTIDKDAIAKMIDFQLENNFKMIFLTPGNSHYNAMSDADMREINEFCVKYTNKRALVCVTEFGHNTRRSLEMARHAAEIGADLFLPFPANWAGAVTVETMVDYYEACARIMPLMLIYPAAGSPENAITVFEKLFARTDRVMAIKDDCCNNVSRRMTIKFSDEYAIFSGGQKQNYMNIYPYGACGYLSTLGMFRPDLAWQFYAAAEKRDLEGMKAVIRDYDMPYFDLILKQKGSFDAGIHATMELFGFCKRYRRAPYYNLSDAEVEVLKDELIKLNILK